eukprot:TRINITY_DN8842_c0_g1_i2.p1 TRINITY_DN8842_c0_g1~~TRINITY_DN8842_c0_g1_i2.p1  ORF type:complete len:107 (-),score=12.02 TRINITY_DN8842_c0_g1_i2:294-614(-)
MRRRPPRSTLSSSSAASDVYKRQVRLSTASNCSCHICASMSRTLAGSAGAQSSHTTMQSSWSYCRDTRRRSLFHVTLGPAPLGSTAPETVNPSEERYCTAVSTASR